MSYADELAELAKKSADEYHAVKQDKTKLEQELADLKVEKEHWYIARTPINEKLEQQGKEIARLKSIVGEEHFTKED